ncbi:MAG: stage II sporulation protein R [Clostridia bacterium]|nr:stage II sporulation protein R [Clostridia bacterium]
MKKLCIIFLTSIIISLTALGFSGAFSGTGNDFATAEYLRIHIRANSNAEDEQAVKYLVRDEIVAYLTPLVANYETKAEAVAGVKANLSAIERKAANVLKRNGFAYGASAEVRTESFPTRVYGEYTLPAGEYTSLIIELGGGTGDNWWCVVYPPLCFTNGQGNVVYKSKIAEIIQSWKNGD